MQVSVETTQGLERKLTLGIPAITVDAEVDRRVADTAKKARLDGFRAGKVPKKVIRQRFGDSLRAEVVSEVVTRSVKDAMTKESLNAVGVPNIDLTNNVAGEDVELVAIFEVYPEVELADLSNIKLEKKIAEVTDGDVENMVEKLRDQRAGWNVVDRKAADGNQLNIDYVGLKDGESFDGGTADGADVVLGSGQMIKGFEAGMVGASAGQELTLDLTFPEDYHMQELAGVDVKFNVTINEVKEKILPALDDAFFSEFEVDGGLDDFKTKVRENMKKQLSDAIDSNLKQQIMDALAEEHEVDLPSALVAEEIKTLRAQTLERFGGNTADFDSSLLPDEMFEEQAGKRIALGIIINQFVMSYEIKPEREQLIEFIDGIAESYENPEEVRNLYLSDEARLKQMHLMVVEKMVVEKVIELAGATDIASTYDEVVGLSQS